MPRHHDRRVRLDLHNISVDIVAAEVDGAVSPVWPADASACGPIATRGPATHRGTP